MLLHRGTNFELFDKCGTNLQIGTGCGVARGLAKRGPWTIMERYELALTRLREMITEPAAANGGRLPPERVLAGELGVGRRTLRRALGTLEGEGRLLRHRGRGTFIARDGAPGAPGIGEIFEDTNPIEVMEVRLAVEPMSARLASLRASRCDIERLEQLAEETRGADGAGAYEEADAAFHRRVAIAARNSLHLALYDALSAVSRDASWRALGENGRCYKSQARYAGHHREITDAIIARDGDRAGDAMYSHLLDVQRVILDTVFAEAAPNAPAKT